MPEVLATGYMVGFIEWACIQAINPYLDLTSRGRHERFIIDKAKFDAKMEEKLKNKNP
jgi:predicted thioesterase